MATEVPQVLVPMATTISVPQSTSLPSVPRGSSVRIPRSVQLHLSRSLTFGVLGDDSQLYPSSKWLTENRDTFAGKRPEEGVTRPDFVITSLDTRKHNPQSKQIFHIKRINKKPVCNVQSWKSAKEPTEEEKRMNVTSEYMTSYNDLPGEPHHLVHKQHKELPPAEGIVPVNTSVNVRSEMMLPVCDTTVIPSAHNPHRYLLRKRKVPPPFKANGNCTKPEIACGIVYPNLEQPRMTIYTPGMMQTSAIPFENEDQSSAPVDYTERVSVSCLTGDSFSRRKYIQPPMGNIIGEPRLPRVPSPVCVSSLAGKNFTRRRPLAAPEAEITLGFDGGVSATSSRRFDDRFLPFMRSKTII